MISRHSLAHPGQVQILLLHDYLYVLFIFNSLKLGQHKIMCKHKNFMHADMVI
jgi:hypothetical protein